MLNPLPLILGNWKLLAIATLASSLITGAAALKLHNMRVDSLKVGWAAQEKEDIAAAEAGVQKICDDNNLVTKENAHALQSKLDATLNRYYGLLKYGSDRTCTATLASAAGGGNGPAGATVPVVQVPLVDGLTAGRLNDDQAARLITLQDIVAAIYKANRQEVLLPDEYRK